MDPLTDRIRLAPSAAVALHRATFAAFMEVGKSAPSTHVTARVMSLLDDAGWRLLPPGDQQEKG